MAEICRFELIIYIVVWFFCSGFTLFKVFNYSLQADALNPYDVQDGWKILGKKQDVSNFEWRTWQTLMKKCWLLYAVHIALANFIKWKFPWLRSWFFLFYGLMALKYIIGTKLLGLILFHCAIANLAAKTRYVTIIWMVNIGLLSLLNCPRSVKILKKLCGDSATQDVYFQFLVCSFSLTNLRCISFSLDYRSAFRRLRSDMMSKTENSHEIDLGDLDRRYNFIALLTYNLYFPLIFTGPILTYDMFNDELNKPQKQWNYCGVKAQLKGACRLLFWFFMIEFVLHFMYFNAIQLSSTQLWEMCMWTLLGIGYCHGQFFMMIYTVMYGVSQWLAKFDDIDTPNGPICISRVYKYSDMWKYFDRGFYKFIQRHIYIPVGGSRHGYKRQLLAVFLSFLFVLYWHGTEEFIFIWVLINFIGILLEISVSNLYHMQCICGNIQKCLSYGMIRRVKGMMHVPLLISSALAIFCFFGGRDVFLIYYQRLFYEAGAASLVIIFVALYCLIQIVMTFEEKHQSKFKKE